MMSSNLEKRRGLMLVISSPSGAGKTTLARKLMAEFDTVALSISATTRTPRPNEVEGQDYYFKTHDRFHDLVKQGAFLEWAKVFDHYYGSLKSETEAKLSAGFDVIFDVDWQGADALHDQVPNDCVSVFILPPSIEALASRLDQRPGSTPEMVARRMADAKAEISHWRRYDYCIINDDLGMAYSQLRNILLVERMKRLRQNNLAPHVRALLGED